MGSPLAGDEYGTVLVLGSHVRQTDPEELAAAAHAPYFSMALAYVPAAEEVVPKRIDVPHRGR